jgi:pimeloyl-ACP methyl ester carboxylesterase
MSQKGINKAEKGNYALINGLNMYYEIHGTGKPLVLIHGAFGSIKTNFGNVLPAFAQINQVIAVELQGHGHTADIDRPLSHEQLAEDVAALLNHLNIENADIYGYSLGGDVTVQLALKYPDLVRKIIFSGGPSYHPDGFFTEFLESDKMMKPGRPWKEYYDSIAPNPSDLPVIAKKIKEMTHAWNGVPDKDLQAIKAPALLIIGDSDIVRLEHVVKMFRLLGGGVPGDLVGIPNSRLAVLPGTTHSSLIERADWLLSMIREFLNTPMPK